MNDLYSEHIGKEYRFNKGDKVPQWIFESDVAFFGTNVIVTAEKDRLFIKGNIPIGFDLREGGKCLVEVRNNNGENCRQVCPQISFMTKCEDL